VWTGGRSTKGSDDRALLFLDYAERWKENKNQTGALKRSEKDTIAGSKNRRITRTSNAIKRRKNAKQRDKGSLHTDVLKHLTWGGLPSADKNTRGEMCRGGTEKMFYRLFGWVSIRENTGL